MADIDTFAAQETLDMVQLAALLQRAKDAGYVIESPEGLISSGSPEAQEAVSRLENLYALAYPNSGDELAEEQPMATDDLEAKMMAAGLDGNTSEAPRRTSRKRP